MAHNHLRRINVPRAPRGSKKGWPVWAGQVTPEINEQLVEIWVEKGGHRGDLVAEALTLYAEMHKREAA